MVINWPQEFQKEDRLNTLFLLSTKARIDGLTPMQCPNSPQLKLFHFYLLRIGVDWDRKSEVGHQAQSGRDRHKYPSWFLVCPTLPQFMVLLTPAILDRHPGWIGRARWIGVDWDRWGKLGQKWIFGALGANHERYIDKWEIVCPNSPHLSQSTPVNGRVCQGISDYPMWNLEDLLTVSKWTETHPRSLDWLVFSFLKNRSTVRTF